jgi:ABC-type multidrug transport system ATPase subunit
LVLARYDIEKSRNDAKSSDCKKGRIINMELKLNNVSKNYGSKKALQNINYTFSNGVIGLLGPNGAGKSTLMRMLSTVETPSEGTILYSDKDIAKHPEILRNVLGYLPQDFGVYPNMNPVEFLEYMAAMKSLPMKEAKKRIDDLLEVLHLTQARNRMVGGFSGGMKQRVGIAQALLNDPKVLIVDEPTVGLDPEERMQFRNLLSSLSSNRIIILSTHIVTDVESIAPNILMLADGKMISSTTQEGLIQKAEGRVWESVVSADKIEELQQRVIISNSMQQSDGIHVRIISNQKPMLNAIQTLPSLEDAYLYATKMK